MFTWIEFYTKFADALLAYKDNRSELIAIIKKVYENTGINMPKMDEGDLIDVDPFTAFAIFNRGQKHESRIMIIRELMGLMGINATVPQDFDGIPVMNPQKSTFYKFGTGRGANDIDNLWNFYEIALAYAEEPSEQNKKDFINYYDICQNQKYVKWNLTMGLYWIRPYKYLNLDSRNRQLLVNKLETKAPWIAKQKNEDFPVPTGAEYLDLCDYYLKQIDEQGLEYSNLVELSAAAFEFAKNEPIGKNFNKYDTTLLLHEYLLYTAGKKTRKEAINFVSETMRGKAVEDGKDINDSFRSVKGITSQMSEMEAAYKGVETAPTLFKEIADLCKNDEAAYDELVTETYDYFGLEKPFLEQTNMSTDTNKTKYWVLALGDKGKYWSECYANNIIAIGWDYLGDLKQYSDKEVIKSKMREHNKSNSSFKNNGLCTWQFANEMQVGDVVYIKKGLTQVVGRCIIESDYIFDDTRSYFKNIRKVKWTHNGIWEDIKDLPRKTLTEWTPFPKAVRDIETALNGVGDRCLYRKKINKSLLKDGLTLPVDCVKDVLTCLGIAEFNKGDHQDIDVIVGDIVYTALLTNVNHCEKYANRTVVQIRYGNNSDIAQALQKIFVSSYNKLVLQGNKSDAVDEIEIGEDIQDNSNEEYYELWTRSNGKLEIKCYPQKEEVEPVPVMDALETIQNYIASQGFTYDSKLIKNFYLSIKSKPFVILAGTSGTGKTKLVELFAEAIGAEYKLVPVRPDWSDASDLFGHVNLKDKFIKGAIFDTLIEARSNPDKPYFLCLDEMNLAMVEHYMSDFLSVMESRKLYDNGRIETEPLFKENQYGNDEEARKEYGVVRMPDNLYIIGTVNMDETTFPFSKKVLDRANTIEFSEVDLNWPDFAEMEEEDTLKLHNSFLKAEYLKLMDCQDKSEIAQKVCAELVEINAILRKAEAHVGYRVRDEICFYLCNNATEEGDLLSYEEAMDLEIMQKILPRINGSNSVVQTLIEELLDYCKNKNYTLSTNKLTFMKRRFEEDGFTSYWL